MSGKSVDDILDYGAPGLEYWERFLPLYDRAFTAPHDIELSALQAAYDEQRGADLAKLDSARTELVQALDQSEAQWAAQCGVAQSLPSCWTSGAGGAALAMVVTQLRRAREDIDAARSAATAIGAAVEPLRQAVLTKAESVLGLLEETPGGVGKLAIAGKSPDDIEAMLGDHPDPWLTTTFKPDVEHKLAAFQAACTATNRCFESHYDTIVAAMNQVLDLPYPQPAPIPVIAPAPEPSPGAPGGRQPEPAPSERGPQPHAVPESAERGSQPHAAPEQAERGSQPQVAPETGWAQRPEPVPVQPHQSYPSVTSGGPQAADFAPTAPASVESPPAQPHSPADLSRPSLPDSSPDSGSAGCAQPQSVPNTPPADAQSVPNARPNGSAQSAPSAPPDGANRSPSAPGAQSEGSNHPQSQPNSDSNGLTSLADLIRSLLSVLDPGKLPSLTDLLHPSDPSAHPDPAPDSQHPAEHPPQPDKDGGAPAGQCPQPDTNHPGQQHHPGSDSGTTGESPSVDARSPSGHCPPGPTTPAPTCDAPLPSCDIPPRSAECPAPQEESRAIPQPDGQSAEHAPASCIIKGPPAPEGTPPSPDDAPLPDTGRVSPDQVQLAPDRDPAPVTPPDRASPPDPSMPLSEVPAPEGNSPHANADPTVEIPEGGVEIPELSDATPL